MAWFVWGEVPSIQAYVFGTTRLRTIVGASALLDEWNRRTAPAIVRQRGGQVLRAAGGVIEACYETEDAALACWEALRWSLAEDLPGLTLAGVVRPSAQESPSEAEQAQWARDLRAARQGVLAVTGGPLAQHCAQAPGEPAVALLPGRDGEPPQPVSQQAWVKHRYYSQQTSGQRLEVDGDLAQAYPGAAFAGDFAALAEHSSPPGYLGLIVADGNAMGQVFQQLRAKSTSATCHAFSEALVSVNRAAVVAAVTQQRPEALAGRLVPCRVLLLGGDDLVVALPAQDAVHVAHHYCREYMTRTGTLLRESFDEPAQQALGVATLTMAAGVVLAHQSLPILTMHALGSELEGSAKRLVRQLAPAGGLPATSAVDYQVVTASGVGSLETLRGELERRVEGETRQLYARPYRVDPDDGRDRLGQLLEAVAALRDAPRSRLKELWRLLGTPAPLAQAKEEFRRHWARFDRAEHREAWRMVAQAGGWRYRPDRPAPAWLVRPTASGAAGERVLYTPLLDAIELVDFLRGEGGDASAER